jgi:hypothetical protein
MVNYVCGSGVDMVNKVCWIGQTQQPPEAFLPIQLERENTFMSRLLIVILPTCTRVMVSYILAQ